MDDDSRTPRSFAQWYRTRPFIGGVLTVLGGVELLFSGQFTVGSLRMQVGIEGFQATLIPIVLVLVGVLATLMPQHRIFYGVIGLAVGLYSLIGVNLGGFFVGMVLACVGGVMIVSWMPRHDETRQQESDTIAGSDRGQQRRAGVESLLSESADQNERSDQNTASTGTAGSQRRARRRAAGGALAIALTVTTAVGLTAGMPQSASAAEPAGMCILGFIGDCSSPSPTPSTAPTSTAQPPGGATDPGTSTSGGSSSSTSGATASSSPAGPTLVAPASSAPVFTGKPALLQGSSLSFSGLRYLGLATVRLSDGSTATVLKLSMDSVTIPGFRLDTRDASGSGTDTVATQMAFSGGVDTYCASLKGIMQNGDAVEYDIKHPPSTNGSVPVTRIISLEVFGITGGSSVLTGFHEMIS